MSETIGGFTLGGPDFPPFASLALAAPDWPSVTDVVLLVEAAATDGAVTIGAEVETLGGFTLGSSPVTVRGGSVLLDYSDRDWTSLPTDARPNVHFAGRANDITVDRALPLRADAARRVAAAVGEIALSNGDGALDAAARGLAVDGQPVTLSVLPRRSSAYAERQLIFSGIGLDWRAEARRMRLRVRDLGYLLDTPMLGIYGGAGGADGNADVKGKPILEVFGLCRNVTLTPLGDGGLQIYQVHARAVDAITAVYVRGATITAGTARAGYAALAAASVTGGTYDWTITATGTYVRIGGAIDGTVTADVRGDATGGYVSSIPGMMRRILARGGAAVSAAGFDNIEVICPGVAGAVFAEQVSFADAVTRLASGGFLWWGDDGGGLITAGRISSATGNSGLLLDETVILGEVEPMEPPPIAWRVTASFRPNWTVQGGGDLIGGITDARRQELGEPSRNVAVADAARRQRSLQAEDVRIETLFDVESEAQGVAQNVLSLMRPGLSMFRVPCGPRALGAPLGQQASLVWPRYGLAAGVDVRVIGQTIRGGRIDLLVFG